MREQATFSIGAAMPPAAPEPAAVGDTCQVSFTLQYKTAGDRQPAPVVKETYCTLNTGDGGLEDAGGLTVSSDGYSASGPALGADSQNVMKTYACSVKWNTPGTKRVQLTATLTFTDGSQLMAEKTIKVRVIGGPIVGNAAPRYRGTTDSPHFTLNATEGQPPDTSLKWEVAVGGDKLTLLDPANADEIQRWEGIEDKYKSCMIRGISGSAALEDTLLQLTYSLDGKSYIATQKLTVRMAKSLRPATRDEGLIQAPDQAVYTPQPIPVWTPQSPIGNKKWYGFGGADFMSCQHIWWTLLDQFDEPLPMEPVNETWEQAVPAHKDIQFILSAGFPQWGTTDKGAFNMPDMFIYFYYGRNNDGTDQLAQQGIIAPTTMGTAVHYYFSGSEQPREGLMVGSFNTTWATNRITHAPLP